MKAAAQLVIILSSILLLGGSACTKINLSGAKGGSQTTGGGQVQNSSSIPLLDGDWEVDYEYKGNSVIGNATLSQQGAAFAGAGQDQDGREWQIEQGQIQGSQVSFEKKYMNTSGPAITYTGELKYLQTPEYTGWCMEGSYTGKGGQISGKWVANPLGQTMQEAPVQQGQPQQQSFPPPQQASHSGESAAENLGDIRPADISGHYVCSYQYNFQKIRSEMWLKNEGKKVSGDGKDIVGKSSEYFTISKGWFEYPKVTLHRQYTKGKGAKDTRTIIFKATISSNGRDINMSGETQHGGHWTAKLVR